jgi:hypothetical protein
MSSTEYLDLADFLVIAEAVLGIDSDTLIKTSRLDLADSALHAPAAAFGGVEFYPDLPPAQGCGAVHPPGPQPSPRGWQ